LTYVAITFNLEHVARINLTNSVLEEVALNKTVGAIDFVG